MGKETKEFLGSGWAFPITFSASTGELELTHYENNINDNIDIILKTNKGERSMQGDFGSGLNQFFFRKMDETLKGEMIDTVKLSLLNYEPRISVKKVDVTFENSEAGLVSILVLYVYNKTNTRHNYVFPFYLNEGTNL